MSQVADEIVEGELVEEASSGSELVHVEPQASVTLFRTDEPAQVVKVATETANALAAVIDAKQLFKNIQGKKHVYVEGWTLLGSMLGVFPVVAWTRKLDDGFEARVEARTRHGELVGAAEAQCTRKEKTWSTRDDYALRSMAQTRAISKALRAPLGFIMTLAGYEAVPESEAAYDGGHSAAPADDGWQPPDEKATPSDTKTLTQPQMKKLRALAKDLSMSDEDLHEYCGAESLKTLTRKQASDAIDALQKRADALADAAPAAAPTEEEMTRASLLEDLRLMYGSDVKIRIAAKVNSLDEISVEQMVELIERADS